MFRVLVTSVCCDPEITCLLYSLLLIHLGVKRLYVVVRLEAQCSIALAVECNIISVHSDTVCFNVCIFSVCCSVITQFILLVTFFTCTLSEM